MVHHSATAGFSLGDQVWVPLAVGRALGVIVEDRGPLGRNGERLYVAAVPNDPHLKEEFLLREHEIARISDEEKRELVGRFAPEAIRDYLINGGLLSMLVRNSPEPVWLRRGPNNNLTFTYIEGYSQTGGKPAPQYALARERIFTPMKSKVVEFVESLGISHSMAEDVVNAIGTAP